MFAPNKIDPRRVVQFITWARRAERDGGASGSVNEQIVSALLNGRLDWLPQSCAQPLAAIQHLIDEGDGWFQLMMVVHRQNWRGEGHHQAETV